MKPRMLLALAVLLVLLMAGSLPAAADGATVPFEGFYDVSPRTVGVDQYGCTLDEFPSVGQATHLGSSTWYSDATSCLDFTTWTGTQTGTSIFTSVDGSQLIGTFSGVAEIVFEPFPHAVFNGNYWVTEGTGRFEGYVGQGVYEGTAILGLTGEITFEGTLTKPEKP